jgi:two-component system cell cycle sensor histidine kinase/response regulator CckA
VGLRVTLRASPAGEVVVEVADNGPGIPDEIRSRIFDPFFTTKGVGMGLGLGLSICHGIVASHGGTIGLDSKVDRGSVFRVVLPASMDASGAATPGAQPLAASADGAVDRGAAAGAVATVAVPARARVLVIDDERALADMIVRLLDDCHVDVAVKGREALDLLDRATTPYDVILCDLMMPDMTGMDLFAEVTRRYNGFEERFVFMTGGAFTPRATEFLARVKNRRLEKPFDRSALRAAVGCSA